MLTWTWQDDILLREMTRVIDQPCEPSCMGAPTFEADERFCEDDDLLAEAQQERDQAQTAGRFWHATTKRQQKRIGELVRERDEARKLASDHAVSLNRQSRTIVLLFGAVCFLVAYVAADLVRRVF